MLGVMSRRAAAIALTSEEQATLNTWSRGRSIPARLVQRARIIRMAAQGKFSQEIAAELHTSRPTVQLWRHRFLALRLDRKSTRLNSSHQIISHAVFCLKKKTQHIQLLC